MCSPPIQAITNPTSKSYTHERQQQASHAAAFETQTSNFLWTTHVDKPTGEPRHDAMISEGVKPATQIEQLSLPLQADLEENKLHHLFDIID